MASSHSELRVILIQARNGQDMEYQEQQCFVERCRVSLDQITSVNVARIDHLPEIHSLIASHDALFIGGAGEYSITKDYPWMPYLLNLVQAASDVSLPTFGSCWGHQLIARALGGAVIFDHDRAELGCHLVELTEEGKKDPLFGDFPASFYANMGHHDRVSELPKNGVELANNTSQPNEAFRIKGKPIYGTQFHSELDAHRERERLIRYRTYYHDQLPSEEEFQQVIHGLKETTEVDHLMYDFLTKFAIQG